MKETMMQTVNKAGDVHQELSEIKKMQKVVDSYWTIWSEGCAGFFTLFCC